MLVVEMNELNREYLHRIKAHSELKRLVKYLKSFFVI